MMRIDAEEMALCRRCLEMSLEKGASKARITMDKNTMDTVGTLNGKTDKVAHCLDQSLSIVLFVDGKYGTYSTNRLEPGHLGEFLDGAINTTRMLAEDSCRDLPGTSRKCKTATSGDELNLYDESIEAISPVQRLEIASGESLFNGGKPVSGNGFTLISEEGEYSDSLCDTFTVDSDGLCCRHTETSFEYWVEVTILTDEGDKFSGSWWDSTTRMDKRRTGICGEKALEIACSQMGPKRLRRGKYDIVVDTEVAGKLVSPILKALNAYSIQQSNSFLKDTLGKQVFNEGLSIIDCCHEPGCGGSRLFDSEGVATHEGPIIDKGTVDHYFINTYMSNKMGMEPTVEEAIRPKVMPFPEPGLTRKDIIEKIGNGVLVTDFNGGNYNPATGNFSYGVEGFVFKKGRISHPFREAVLTGNIIDLWSRLLFAGEDCRPCQSRLVPTIAFGGADLSA